MIKRVIIFLLLICFSKSFKAQNWIQMDIQQNVECFYEDSIDNLLYVGGNIGSFGGIPTSNGIGIWNNNNWDTLPNILCGYTTSICRYKNKLYVSGVFNITSPYNCPSKNLMAFDLTNNIWSTVSTGLWENGNEQIGGANLKVINDELYIYGSFDSISNLKVNNIVKFNGTTWSSLNFPSKNAIINGIEYYNNELYVFGQFWNLTGNPNMDCLVKYNGTNWLSVGADFESAHSINSITKYKNELYVGGYFLKSDNCPGDNITKYSNSLWQDVNNGFSLYGFPDAPVKYLEVYKDTLYISGSFDRMGILPAKSIVKYDGNSFCAIDNSIGQCPAKIAVYKNKLYLGCTWFASGQNYQDTIWYLGAQNKFSPDTCQIFAVGLNEKYNSSNLNISPNPITSILNIKAENIQFLSSNITIKNNIGLIIYSTAFTSQIDLSNFQSGIYFLTIEDKLNKKTFKIIKQ